MSKDLNEAIFELIYRNAMKDATLQQAYSGEKAILTSDKTDRIRELLKGHIDQLIEGEYKNKDREEGKKNYDKVFYNLANQICIIMMEEIPENDFTFGNAQKLINMTVKYFYLLVYNNSELRNCFEYCHCPMDRIMISKVVSNYRLAIKNKSANKTYEKFMMKNKEVSCWSSVSWSDIVISNPSEEVTFGVDVYKHYQMMVDYLSEAEGQIPIEYDYFQYYDNSK